MRGAERGCVCAKGSRLLSGQVGIINLAASHVIMLTANWARGRQCG